MKILSRSALLLSGLLLAGVLFSSPAPASVGVSFSFFYSNLSPHGHWLASASYGNVWQPYGYAAGWNPYYDGHWVYSDVGWTWVSDYAWGGIPYHYGTWIPDPYYGWVWVPGYVWAPSWVVFREGPGYIGWAPVRPSFSVGASFHFGDWDDDHFVFVRSGDVFCNRVRQYAVPVSRTKVIVHNTNIVQNTFVVKNNVVINNGPRRDFVEHAVGRRLQTVPIERVREAGPGRGFDRRQAQIDRGRFPNGLRAAEPYRQGKASAEHRVDRRGDDRGIDRRGDDRGIDRRGADRGIDRRDDRGSGVQTPRESLDRGSPGPRRSHDRGATVRPEASAEPHGVDRSAPGARRVDRGRSFEPPDRARRVDRQATGFSRKGNSPVERGDRALDRSSGRGRGAVQERREMRTVERRDFPFERIDPRSSVRGGSVRDDGTRRVPGRGGAARTERMGRKPMVRGGEPVDQRGGVVKKGGKQRFDHRVR